jgi:hypothetical protein
MEFIRNTFVFLALAFVGLTNTHATDALPSWNDTGPKKAVVAFVEKVTKEGSPDFVPPNERIAVFDNDGTLWCEQPMYFQFLFALDRVKALAPQHPEWKTTEPFAPLLKGDAKGALAGGEPAIRKIVMATHAGMTTDEFHNRRGLDRDREASEERAAPDRDGLSADARPVGINQHIGRRPIAAFGNSDGDLQMLKWTAAGSGPRFCLYVHHPRCGARVRLRSPVTHRQARQRPR